MANELVLRFVLPALSGIAHNFWPLQVKACLVIVIALALVRSMRVNASAASRHLVMTCAIAAVLSLPALSALPSWSLPGAAPPSLIPMIRIPLGPTVKVVTTFDTNGEHQITQTLSGSPEENMKHHPHDTLTLPIRTDVSTTYERGYITPSGIAFYLVTIVSFVLLVRMALMIVGLVQLTSRSQAAAVGMSEYLPAGMERVRIRFGGVAPMTWGWLRPVLLLPSDSEDWPEERLRAVILHECAHIARRDWLTQTLAQLVCAFCCWNPLAWRLTKEMRREAEIACDDAVLMAGIAAADYASHLVDVAKLLKSARKRPAGAIAMASRSEVEARLAAILDKGRPRELANVRTRLDGLCVAAVVLLALGTGGVRAAKPQPYPLPSPTGAAKTEYPTPHR